MGISFLLETKKGRGKSTHEILPESYLWLNNIEDITEGLIHPGREVRGEESQWPFDQAAVIDGPYPGGQSIKN